MRAKDVMTTEVITIDPDASVHALAALLSERGTSGVPVVDPDNRDVMTRDVVSVSDTTELADIARDQEDQAGAGGSRRQARRHRQPSQPGASSGNDEECATDDRRSPRSRDRRPAPRGTAGEELGGYFVGGQHRPGPGGSSLVLR
jgi:hypothetical protein